MTTELEAILAYHKESKHNFKAYASGPHRLDMQIKPDPFLNYRGTQLLNLDLWSDKQIKAEIFPAYEQAFSPEKIKPSELSAKSISRLFFDSFAISAWKAAGGTKWPLRVNPSSGNLHPTEAYLLSGPVKGFLKNPSVCHYAPLPHALELRAEFSRETWELIRSGFPEGTLFVGLTSIYWRVSWKYGLRAFRYAQHDIGHAIAALTFAAAGLGWRTSLLLDMGSKEVAALLGISGEKGHEKQEPACLLAVYPAGETCSRGRVSSAVVPAFKNLSWKGIPNILSTKHVEWVGIEKAASAAQKNGTDYLEQKREPESGTQSVSSLKPSSFKSRSDLETVPLRSAIHGRRSAIEMNNSAYMEKETFYAILKRTLPENNPIFDSLAFGSFTHLLLFVNRVKDVLPGLYIFLRNPGEKERLKTAMKPDFLWEKPKNCPSDLELYMLMEETLHYFAAQLSCSQRKAADACFTACMLSEFEEPLNRFGAWIYPYLFWECGILGQLLYLEAEANGLRGCGIGCFFDDPLHEAIGLKGFEYQDLYHFAVGYPLQEIGVITLPAYEE
ncbi:SagB/ThcOx family dehydrogenase [Methanosarcina sp. MSH10X1]|uniref:nitroreductase family protein n=1 Tax=Methanosarcina sp. MSH10X1 TaxID=2507075 RepID=UPI000FFB4928|nr:nitroreductase family protein [Methanosarcina sp. MSH10X1]RXA21905.1 SagB/ThcOx family dehydrogenase [Methanosarcina sp. MSH10X1]